MQRRRRGQANIKNPIKNYEGSFAHNQNNQNEYGNPFLSDNQQYSSQNNSNEFATQIFDRNSSDDTRIWDSSNLDSTPIEQTPQEQMDYTYLSVYDNQEYIDDGYEEYDPEEDEVYQKELKRDRWKLVYFFINLCGSIFGLLLIFLLLAVLYNMIAWVMSDLIKIFGFLGVR